MKLVETPLPGAFLIEPSPHADERGLFVRTWDRALFEERGLDAQLAQCSTSFNRRAGTLRGLHYQAAPAEEVKLVRCTAGAIFDVIVDLRAGSPTRLKWFGAELTAENRKQLYIPKGFAHGFQTLRDDSEVFYQISQFYRPELGRGVRWDDPAFAIAWPPAAQRLLSDKDRTYPDFAP